MLGMYSYLKADYDGPVFPPDFKERCEFIQETLGIEFRRVQQLRTARGHHALIQLADPLPAWVVCTLQAILGSDYRRETFNLVRVLALSDAPDFWQPRWNVFYERKYGRVEPMINREEYRGSSKPALDASQIRGDATVLTVSRVEEISIPDAEREGGKRKALVIEFAEFPDNSYWPNSTGINILCDQFGEDEKRWVGESVPLVKVDAKNPRTNKTEPKMWVAGGDEWEAILTGGGKGRKTVAKKTAAKKATRRR